MVGPGMGTRKREHRTAGDGDLAVPRRCARGSDDHEGTPRSLGDTSARATAPSFVQLHAEFGRTLDELLATGILDPDATLDARAEACWYRWPPGDSALVALGKLGAFLDLLCRAALDGDPAALGDPDAAFRARLVVARAVGRERPLRDCVRARLRTGRFPFLFVGGRRAVAAIRLDVRWEDGRLAARTLHAALRVAGLDPTAQAYTDLFADPVPGGGAAPFVVAVAIRAQLHAAASLGVPLVALGCRVEMALTRDGLAHRVLRHPAARGASRRRDRYQAHVAAALAAEASPVPAVAARHGRESEVGA